MRHDGDGRVVGVGARTRTIPPALRRALQHRDQTCRFPGCHVRVADGHHVRHWAQGGPTKLSNLALLCCRHHRAVHEEGYQVERGADGARSAPSAEHRAGARARASPGGSGSGSTWAGRSTCYIRELGDPPDLRSRYRQACSTGLPGRRSSPTAMAMFNRFHRMPLTNAVW
ncbi:MAG TPA: HNH endonuclease signature motif containing protein [Candidatus Limnocylindria bacterium]|nr:HNH endonuclease signature motif containing protein [Candidatus Limnocylindria bacterium]